MTESVCSFFTIKVMVRDICLFVYCTVSGRQQQAITKAGRPTYLKRYIKKNDFSHIVGCSWQSWHVVKLRCNQNATIKTSSSLTVSEHTRQCKRASPTNIFLVNTLLIDHEYTRVYMPESCWPVTSIMFPVTFIFKFKRNTGL